MEDDQQVGNPPDLIAFLKGLENRRGRGNLPRGKSAFEESFVNFGILLGKLFFVEALGHFFSEEILNLEEDLAFLVGKLEEFHTVDLDHQDFMGMTFLFCQGDFLVPTASWACDGHGCQNAD